MKKLISILLTVIMVMSMVACGGTEQTVTLTYEENGLSYEYTMTAKGDVVKKITQKATIDLTQFPSESIGTFDETREETEKIFDKLSSATYTVDESDDEIVETIVLDVSSADKIEELTDAGVLEFDVDNANIISLEKTIQNLEALGFTVVE